MKIPNDWLQYLTSATETPFGSSLAWMIVVLCIGMLVVAIIGMLVGRSGANRYSSNQWWRDYDGTTYDHSSFSSDDGSCLDWGSSSWFGGGDIGSGGGDGDWFDGD